MRSRTASPPSGDPSSSSAAAAAACLAAAASASATRARASRRPRAPSPPRRIAAPPPPRLGGDGVPRRGGERRLEALRALPRELMALLRARVRDDAAPREALLRGHRGGARLLPRGGARVGAASAAAARRSAAASPAAARPRLRRRATDLALSLEDELTKTVNHRGGPPRLVLPLARHRRERSARFGAPRVATARRRSRRARTRARAAADVFLPRGRRPARAPPRRLHHLGQSPLDARPHARRVPRRREEEVLGGVRVRDERRQRTGHFLHPSLLARRRRGSGSVVERAPPEDHGGAPGVCGDGVDAFFGRGSLRRHLFEVARVLRLERLPRGLFARLRGAPGLGGGVRFSARASRGPPRAPPSRLARRRRRRDSAPPSRAVRSAAPPRAPSPRAPRRGSIPPSPRGLCTRRPPRRAPSTAAPAPPRRIAPSPPWRRARRRFVRDRADPASARSASTVSARTRSCAARSSSKVFARLASRFAASASASASLCAPSTRSPRAPRRASPPRSRRVASRTPPAPPSRPRRSARRRLSRPPPSAPPPRTDASPRRSRAPSSRPRAPYRARRTRARREARDRARRRGPGRRPARDDASTSAAASRPRSSAALSTSPRRRSISARYRDASRSVFAAAKEACEPKSPDASVRASGTAAAKSSAAPADSRIASAPTRRAVSGRRSGRFAFFRVLAREGSSADEEESSFSSPDEGPAPSSSASRRSRSAFPSFSSAISRRRRCRDSARRTLPELLPEPRHLRVESAPTPEARHRLLQRARPRAPVRLRRAELPLQPLHLVLVPRRRLLVLERPRRNAAPRVRALGAAVRRRRVGARLRQLASELVHARR